MANIKISGLPSAILPLDGPNSFFEVQTIEAGVDVSRKVASDDLTLAAAIIVEDEGVPLATGATTLDFVGAGVVASGGGATKTITIPGFTLPDPLTLDSGIFTNVDPIDLVDADVALVVGGVGSAQHVEIDLTSMQSKTGLAAAGVLNLNQLGGNVDIGPQSGTGVVRLFADGGIAIRARDDRFELFSPASPGLGSPQDMRLRWQQQDGTPLMDFGYDGAVNVIMEIRNHGASLIVTSENNAGATIPLLTLDPDAVTVALQNFVFDIDQAVGAGQDNFVLTYDDASGLISLEAGGGVIPDPLIIGSINATSSEAVSQTVTPYANVALNIGANLVGTQGMMQINSQNIQTRQSSGGFNATLFININGAGTAGSNVIIGGLNGAQVEVDFGVAVRFQHAQSGTVVAETAAAAAGGFLANNLATGAGLERVLTTADLGGAGPEYIEQVGDDTVNNTTVLVNTDLLLTNIPIGRYRIDMMILARDVAVSNCGMRTDIATTGVGGGNVLRGSIKTFSGSGVPVTDIQGLVTDVMLFPSLSTGSATDEIFFWGVIDVTSGTNSIQVQFAQETAQVGDLDFESGSFLALTKLD